MKVPHFKLFLVMVTTSTVLNAQVYDLYKPEVFRNEAGELPYRIMEPVSIESSQAYPLVIFLHGSGERGNNNKSQLTHVADHFAAADLRLKYPAFVVFPQCPQSDRWNNGDYSNPSQRTDYKMSAQPSTTGKLVMSLVEKLIRNLPVDPDRVYLAGLSMGGYGTFDLVARNPDVFAAAVPVCGAGDAEVLAQKVEMPIWVAHGADDPTVPVGTSRSVVEMMRKNGKTVVYTEFPGVKHDSWNPLFGQNPLILDWLFAQKR